MTLHLTDERLLLAGDWHGVLNQGKAAMNRAHDLGVNTIIQLGDFGYWGTEDSERTLNTWQTFLDRWDITLYFVDGNHENFHALYKKYPIDPNTGMRYLRERIIHLPRGYVFTWNDLRVLAFGGAYSIDQDMRAKNVSWWKEEEITDEDITTALKNIGDEKIDIMLSHDSPSIVPNLVTDNLRNQHTVGQHFGFHHLEGAQRHRMRLDDVYLAAEPALVAHGHYHQYFVEPAPYGAVACLNEGRASLRQSTMVLDMETLNEFRAMRRMP